MGKMAEKRESNWRLYHFSYSWKIREKRQEKWESLKHLGDNIKEYKHMHLGISPQKTEEKKRAQKE